jgi:hypothetical protein
MMPAKSTRILLVEGREDREVVYQLCNYHSINNRDLFEVEIKDGYESLKDDLMVRPQTGATAIGAVVDADVDPAERWKSLRGALHNAGYNDIPGQPNHGGTIIPSHGVLPSIGIWLMPDNKLAGILEDFARFLVKGGDPLLPRAESCIDAIPAEDRRFKARYRSKALIHTWLAWQEDPGTPLGSAITKRYLNADYDLAMQFVQWLMDLFPST